MAELNRKVINKVASTLNDLEAIELRAGGTQAGAAGVLADAARIALALAVDSDYVARVDAKEIGTKLDDLVGVADFIPAEDLDRSMVAALKQGAALLAAGKLDGERRLEVARIISKPLALAARTLRDRVQGKKTINRKAKKGKQPARAPLYDATPEVEELLASRPDPKPEELFQSFRGLGFTASRRRLWEI